MIIIFWDEIVIVWLIPIKTYALAVQSSYDSTALTRNHIITLEKSYIDSLNIKLKSIETCLFAL